MRIKVTDDARALHVLFVLVGGRGRLGACSPSKFFHLRGTKVQFNCFPDADARAHAGPGGAGFGYATRMRITEISAIVHSTEILHRVEEREIT